MSLLNTSYQEVTDKAIEARFEKRFVSLIDRFEALDFELETYYREIVWTHTALLLFPFIVLMRLQGAVMKVEFPFRVSIYTPLMIRHDLSTYAEMTPPNDYMFMTLFSKQKILITSTMVASQSKPEKGYYRLNMPGAPVKSLWKAHQEQIELRQNEGWTIESPANFKTFAQLMHRHSHAMTGGIAT